MTTALQQRVALVVAMLVLAGSGIALLVQDDEETVALPPVTATPTATLAKAKATRTPVATDRAPSTVAPGRTQPPAAATAAPTPTPNLGVAQPPEAGTYRYRSRTDGETTEEFLEIADRGAGRQSEEQDGIRADIVWSSESKLIDRISFGPGFDCDFAPNIAELKFPLKIGAAWNQEGKCTSSGATITFTGRSRVTGASKRTVDGVSVDTWRVQSTANVKFSSPEGSFEQDVEQDAYLSPEYGLYVHSTDRTKGTDPSTGERMDETTVKDLVRLSPG